MTKPYQIGFIVVLSFGLPAQSRPEFEVASVRAYRTDLPSPRRQLDCIGGRLVAVAMPAQYLIEWAFDIRTDFSVPEWAGPLGEKYEIEASAAGPVSLDQCKLMTQRLLEDRFQLKLHREAKIVPVYELIVGKDGSKLHEATGDGVWIRGRKTSSKGWEPWMIAASLASIPDVGRPVVDKTGLKGLFEFRLDYAVDARDDRPN